MSDDAVVLSEVGEGIGGVLLFVNDGYLSTLEVYDYRGGPILPFPSVDRLRFSPSQ
jgi:hypothetical protein